MGQAAIPIALAVAAAGVQSYNTYKTAKKQDRTAAQGIKRQQEIQQETNRRLNDSLMFFEQSQPDDIKADFSDKFRRQLRLKQQLALAGLEQSGGVSDEAVLAAHQAGDTAMDYGDFLQGVFSRIDAPGEQRRQEGEERTELGSALDVFRRNSAGEDFITKLKVQSIQRNPWLDILAAGLQGASSGMAAGSFSVPSGGGAPITTVPGSTLPPSAFYTSSGNALPGMPGSSLYGLGP